MCGIAGIIAEAGRALEYQVGPLIAAQSHRGPDDCGVWADDMCALGHRRLAIIDLSDAGRQPLSNEDGTVWITFNGEIYNTTAICDRTRLTLPPLLLPLSGPQVWSPCQYTRRILPRFRQQAQQLSSDPSW